MSDLIIKPEVVEAREKQKARELQRERRQLAYGFLCANISGPSVPETHESAVKRYLKLADELLKQTDPDAPVDSK